MTDLEKRLIEILNLHFENQLLNTFNHAKWCDLTSLKDNCTCGRTLLEDLEHANPNT